MTIRSWLKRHKISYKQFQTLFETQGFLKFFIKTSSTAKGIWAFDHKQAGIRAHIFNSLVLPIKFHGYFIDLTISVLRIKDKSSSEVDPL